MSTPIVTERLEARIAELEAKEKNNYDVLALNAGKLSQLKDRLAAASKVVEAARRISESSVTYCHCINRIPLHDALAAYDALNDGERDDKDR